MTGATLLRGGFLARGPAGGWCFASRGNIHVHPEMDSARRCGETRFKHKFTLHRVAAIVDGQALVIDPKQEAATVLEATSRPTRMRWVVPSEMQQDFNELMVPFAKALKLTQPQVIRQNCSRSISFPESTY